MGMQSHIEKLEKLYEITKTLYSENDLDLLLDRILEKITEVLEAERSSLFLLDKDTNELWYRIAQDLDIRDIRIPVGQGIVGVAAERMQIINIEDAYSDPRFNKTIDDRSGYRTRTILCVPLISKTGLLLGVVQVLNKKQGVFTKSDVDIAKAFSSQVSMCIDTLTINSEKELMLLSFVKAVTEAIEARYPKTMGHSTRVARMVSGLAKELGYNSQRRAFAEIAAFFHDIGRIKQNPDSKDEQNEFNPFEYENNDEHINKGLEILNDLYIIKEMSGLKKVVQSHHEKYDGTGFPNKLSGTAIPEESRLIAIAEAFEYLTYGSGDSPLEIADVLKQLPKLSGSTLDPKILDIFVNAQLFHAERREFKRFDKSFAIIYKVIKSSQLTDEERNSIPEDEQKEETLNISGNGLLFKTDYYIPVGTLLEVTIYLPGVKLYVIARVVRTDRRPFSKGYYMGIKFLNLSPAINHKLEKYFVDLEKSKKSIKRI